MLDHPKTGMTVWFKHGDQVLSGTVISEKTIDSFYSVAVPAGIPKLLLPQEMFLTKEEVL